MPEDRFNHGGGGGGHNDGDGDGDGEARHPSLKKVTARNQALRRGLSRHVSDPCPVRATTQSSPIQDGMTTSYKGKELTRNPAAS